jgi:hypothetical protein
MTSIMFRVHLPKRSRKGRQPFLPRNDGTFLVVQLRLPGQGAAFVSLRLAYAK